MSCVSCGKRFVRGLGDRTQLRAGRILEALLAMAQRLTVPMLIDGPEQTAMNAARRGLAVLKAGQIGIQSKMTGRLLWHPANRN